MSEDNNLVTLSGITASQPILDHCLYGEEFFAFDISIPRLSGAADVLPLTVSGRLMDRMPQVGDHITLRGQLRSYNKQVEGFSRLIITVFAKTFAIENECKEFINDIAITGFICKPVIYRQTPFQREIADILVAVNRQYGKSDYLPCIAWGRNARFASKLAVGEQIRLEGRVQSRKYQKVLSESEMPVERTAYEISCSMIEALQAQQPTADSSWQREDWHGDSEETEGEAYSYSTAIADGNTESADDEYMGTLIK